VDILVGKVTEASSGSGNAGPAGSAVGLVLAVRISRRRAATEPARAERRRGAIRPDPPRSMVLTLLVEDATALAARIEPGVSRLSLRPLPRR